MLSVRDLRPLPADVRVHHEALGVAGDGSLGLMLSRTAARWPGLTAVVDLVGGRERTFGALLDEVERFAAYLRARGVGPADVVLLQSPNALEALVAWWAVWQIGGVAVPIVDIYRAHELEQIVAAVRPEAVVTVAEHRGHRPPEMFDALLDGAGIVAKARVVLEGESPGWTAFPQALAVADRAAVPVARAGAPDPSGPGVPALVLFTSGTTSRPKGVVHTSRSLTADALQFTRSYGLGWQDACYLPVPLAHVTGVLFGMLVPGMVGGRTVLARMRSLERAAGEAIEHEATWTVGPVAEVPALEAAMRAVGMATPRLRIFATGGTNVAAADLIAAEALGIGPCRSYGMTECPTVTVPSGADPARHRTGTDGRLPPGVECEAMDPETRERLPLGDEGELRVRGPERMLGYLDPDETVAAVDAEGWFWTGDLGRVDGEGCVTVTGRIKDIINRGGEKFSAREIEEVLAAHPGVQAVAVVAAPDARYGEVPAAFIVVEAGAVAPTDRELAGWLAERGVAAQKTPARWRRVAALPMTASGKVRKGELRSSLSDVN